MKKKFSDVIGGVAILGLISLASAFEARSFDQNFYCPLTLRGEPSARASLRLNEDEGSLAYTLEVKKVKDITMAHLHLGKVGEISTPVAWLYPDSPPPRLIPGEFDGVLAKGVVTAEDLIGPLRSKPLSALIDRIRAGEVYLNIHTKEHAAGEICGLVQLVDPAELEHK